MAMPISTHQMVKNTQRREKFRNEYPSDAQLEGHVTRTTATALVLLESERRPELSLKQIFKKLCKKWGWQFDEVERKTVLFWAKNAGILTGSEPAYVAADPDVSVNSNDAMLVADHKGFMKPSEAEQKYSDSMGAIAFKKQAAEAAEQQALSDRDAAVHKALGVMG